MRRLRTALALLLAFALVSAAFAQTDKDGRISRGVSLFSQEKYSEALETFNRVLSDPGASGQRADAVYWAGLSYIALGDAANARRSLDSFLKEYPTHGLVPDAMYQRGRLYYQSSEFEDGIRTFGAFLEKYPDHPFVPSALFWTADCLFSLGRLPEAESMFRSLMADYPNSVKSEAANYKLSLIRYKYRENQLLTLLKWSHEESLRVIEEFQRREKAYEQALTVYQRRLSDAGILPSSAVAAPAPSDAESRIAALNARIDELTRAQSTVNNPASTTFEGKERLLTLKSEALELLASYVDWLAENLEREAQP